MTQGSPRAPTTWSSLSIQPAGRRRTTHFFARHSSRGRRRTRRPQAPEQSLRQRSIPETDRCVVREKPGCQGPRSATLRAGKQTALFRGLHLARSPCEAQPISPTPPARNDGNRSPRSWRDTGQSKDADKPPMPYPEGIGVPNDVLRSV